MIPKHFRSLSLGLGHSKRWNFTCKVPPLFCPMLSGGVVPTWNVYSFSLVPAWVWSPQLTSSSINWGRSPSLRWLEAPLRWREALYWVQHQAFPQQVEFLVAVEIYLWLLELQFLGMEANIVFTGTSSLEHLDECRVMFLFSGTAD